MQCVGSAGPPPLDPMPCIKLGSFTQDCSSLCRQNSLSIAVDRAFLREEDKCPLFLRRLLQLPQLPQDAVVAILVSFLLWELDS